MFLQNEFVKKETTNTPPAKMVFKLVVETKMRKLLKWTDLIEKGIDEGNGEILLQMGAKNSEQIAKVQTYFFSPM